MNRFAPTRYANAFILFLAVFFLSLSSQEPLFSQQKKPGPPPQYVFDLYQKILSINVSLLQYEDALIFRAKENHSIDWEAAQKRFTTVRRQTLSLRALAGHLEKSVPNSHPMMGKIQNLKQRLFLVIQAHQKKLGRLRELAGSNVDFMDQAVEQACGEIPASEPGLRDLNSFIFPVEKVEDHF